MSEYLKMPKKIKVSKTHPFTGKKNTMEIDADFREYEDWALHGMLIQNAMPDATHDQREFLISGLLPGEYDELMKNKNE